MPNANSNASLPLVMVVDDDAFMLDFLHEVLSDHFRITTANSGAQALELASQQPPSLILADIRMPEMDGFTFCQTIKDDFELGDTPVLFLSALDGIEDRLHGYAVGGEDFVTKPVSPKILLAKVNKVLAQQEERQQLKSQVSYATTTAMVAMTSMSETGLIIEDVKHFNVCDSPTALAKALHESLEPFGVGGVVEILPEHGSSVALNAYGPASELELSVLSHMATMGRIAQYKSRMAISYPRARMVITNMPVDDPDRCGRLRDHLAVLVEAAEVRLQAIESETLARARGTAIAGTLDALIKAIADIDQLQRQRRLDETMVLNELLHRVEMAMTGLQLTERQESTLLTTIRDGLEIFYNTQVIDEHLQNELSLVIRDLKGVSS